MAFSRSATQQLALVLNRLQQTPCLSVHPSWQPNIWYSDCGSDCLLHTSSCHTKSQCAGVVHGDTLFLVGNLQSPNPEERPVLPTTIVMCQYHFPTQKWTRLKLRGAPGICHYPLLAAHKDQLILFGGEQATSLSQQVACRRGLSLQWGKRQHNCCALSV